jgi:hypothetical protein
MTVFFYICEYLGVSPQEFFALDNANPVLLGELIAVLKSLDAEALRNLLAISKKMGSGTGK